MKVGVAALATLVLLGGGTARAECLEWTFTGDAPPRVATVGNAARRVNFVRDGSLKPGCPDASAGCRKGAFVVPGDAVLVATGEKAGAQDTWTCAAFTNAKGVTTPGLLPTASLLPETEPAAGAASWTGHWLRVEATLDIRDAPAGRLAVRGDATWGAGDPARVRNGGVHIGQVEGTAAPDGAGVLAFTEGEGRTLPYSPGDDTACSIRMLRRGPYLVVKDNMGCGGMNVSFTGIYRRR